MTSSAPVTPPSPIIDWHVLGQVLVASITIGVALVTLFSLGVASLSAARSHNAGRTQQILGRVGVTVTTALVGAVVAWGFYIITQKG